MKFLLVLAFAAVATGTALRPMTTQIDQYVLDLIGNDGKVDYVFDPEDGTIDGK